MTDTTPHHINTMIWTLSRLRLEGDSEGAFTLWSIIEEEIEKIQDPVQYLAVYARSEIVFKQYLLGWP